MAKKSKTWGYALVAPRRPSLKKQLSALASFGLDVSDQGPVWRDSFRKIKRGRKGEDDRLIGRADLLTAVEPGDKVLVVNAECLGVSALDAEWFVDELQKKGATLVVSERVWTVEPGGSSAELVLEIKRMHNRAYQRKWRAEKQKSASE